MARLSKAAKEEQAGRISDRFEMKRRSNIESFPRDIPQILKEEENQLTQEMVEAINKGEVFVRRVTVNRNLTPEQLINATGRKQYVDERVLKTMPSQGVGVEEIDVYFFNCGRRLTIAEQEEALVKFGLMPDYYAQAQVNIDDPSLADKHPNGAPWDKDGGTTSYLAFICNDGVRGIDVHRVVRSWRVVWWSAGVLKAPRVL